MAPSGPWQHCLLRPLPQPPLRSGPDAREPAAGSQSPSSVSWHRAGQSPEKDNTGPQAFRACSMWSPRGVLAWSPSGSEHSTGEGCKAEGGGAGRETKAGVGPLVALAHRGLCVSVKRGRGWPHSLPHGGGGELPHGRRCSTPVPSPQEPASFTASGWRCAPHNTTSRRTTPQGLGDKENRARRTLHHWP